MNSLYQNLGIAGKVVAGALTLLIGPLVPLATALDEINPVAAALGFAGLILTAIVWGWALPTLRDPDARRERPLAWVLIVTAAVSLPAPGVWWAVQHQQWDGLSDGAFRLVVLCFAMGLISLGRWARQQNR
jgi:hypothetical protein